MKPLHDELRRGDRAGLNLGREEAEPGRLERIALLERLASAAEDAEAGVVLTARAFVAGRASRQDVADFVAALDRAEAAIRVANRPPKSPGGKSGFSVDVSPASGSL